MDSCISYVDVAISDVKNPVTRFGKCSFLPRVDVVLIVLIKYKKSLNFSHEPRGANFYC